MEHEEDPVDANNDQANEVVVSTEDNRDTDTDEEESQAEFYDEENKSDCSEEGNKSALGIEIGEADEEENDASLEIGIYIYISDICERY